MGEQTGGRVIDGRAALACVAVSLGLASTWLLNVTAYPSFNDVLPLARDIATVFGGLLSLACALLAMRRPRVLASGGVLMAGIACGIVGCAGMLAGARLGSPALVTLCSCMRSVAGTTYTLYLVFALMALAPQAGLPVLVGAYFLKYLWMAALGAAPFGVQCAAFVLAQVAPLGLLAPLARPVLVRASGGASPRELSVTNPLSFLPLTHRLFVAILLFEAAMGFAITYGSQASFPQPTILAFGVFAAVMLVVLARRRASLDGLYALAFALVLGGLLLVPGISAARASGGGLSAGLGASASNALLEAGSGVIGVAVWLMAAALGRRNEPAAMATAMVIAAARGFGTELGAASGHLQNYLEGASADVAMLFVAAIALGFAVYNFMLARRFSFDATVAEVRPAAPVVELDESDAPRVADLDRRCAELSDAHGLTAREREVLALLARGRNAAYIQESLTLSRNTVKSYVARVYGKLGVHAHQEVIDLVEGAGEQPKAGLIAVDAICDELAAVYRLTEREGEVLHYIAHGRNSEAIRASMGIARNTVKTHAASVYAKLGVHAQQEIIDMVERYATGHTGRASVDEAYRRGRSETAG